MAHKTMHTLTSELKSVKLALEEITKRERQVRRVHVIECESNDDVVFSCAAARLAASDGAHARS